MGFGYLPHAVPEESVRHQRGRERDLVDVLVLAPARTPVHRMQLEPQQLVAQRVVERFGVEADRESELAKR